MADTDAPLWTKGAQVCTSRAETNCTTSLCYVKVVGNGLISILKSLNDDKTLQTLTKNSFYTWKQDLGATVL